MADQKIPPQDDLLIEVILAEARTLNGEAAPEPVNTSAQTGNPASEQPRHLNTAAPERRQNPAENAAQVSVTQPAPVRGEETAHKKKRLFGRKREIPEYNEEDDIYYGIQLKSLEEYRRDYENTIMIDSKKVREAQQRSEFSYLFSQQDENDEIDNKIAEQFKSIHDDREKRVNEVLRRAGVEDADDVFSFCHEPSAEDCAVMPEKAATPSPLPQEEPVTEPGQPPAVPTPSPTPAVPPSPSPVPTPETKPEILPGPRREPEIPPPLNEPVNRPEPVQPAVQPAPGYAPGIRCEEPPAQPVKEPAHTPSVKEQTPPPVPRQEPPAHQAPVQLRGNEAQATDYRPNSGKPVHMIDLNDFAAILAAEAKNYTQPKPEPPAAIPMPAPKRPARQEVKIPIILEQTSEFESIGPGEEPLLEPEQPEEAQEDFQQTIPFPEVFSAPVPPEVPQPDAAKKKKRFSLFGNEEEENDTMEEPAPEPAELEDYDSPSDAQSILHELSSTVRKLCLRLAVTGIAAALLFGVWFLGEASGILPQAIRFGLDVKSYLILNLVFLLISTAFCAGPIWNGLKSLFVFQATADSALAVADIAAVTQCVLLFFSENEIKAGTLHVYACLTALALFLNTAGKLNMARRIYKNFRMIASPEQKQAVVLYDDHNTALQMAKGCVIDTPTIAYQTKTGFLKHFLHYSYEPDPSDRASQVMAPIGFACALILCIVTVVLTKSMSHAITTFAVAACISVPFANMFSVNLPLNKLSKIASRCGAMVTGYPTVEEFSSVNAVIVDAKDLFPKGTVILNGIKTFAGQRIDEAIVDATALMCAVGGPLSDLFDQIIKSKHEMLPKIDHPVYEDERGVTGWVSGRRILVGSRSLMEAHSIEPPSRDYEEKYIQGGKKIIYLASGGDLVAMFILSYNSDRRRSMELRRMEDNGISLIVRTCDPNITPKLLADCFGLDEQGVRVLPDSLGSIYTELTAAPQEESPALMATKGRPTAMMRMLTACVRQRGNISIAVALQNVAVVLGILLVGFLTVYSGLSQLSTAAVLIYELFWVAAVILVPKLRKP